MRLTADKRRHGYFCGTKDNNGLGGRSSKERVDEQRERRPRRYLLFHNRHRLGEMAENWEFVLVHY